MLHTLLSQENPLLYFSLKFLQMSTAGVHSTDTLTVCFCAGTSNIFNNVNEESCIVSYNKSGHNDILLLFRCSVLRYTLDAHIFLQPQPISLTKTHHA
jgi:hypothetical protein